MDRIKVVVTNRRARHDYDILDTYEAGIVLEGTEVKSLREGKVSLSDTYAKPVNGELWLFNLHIGRYQPATPLGHDPTRPRKLLMHREEIASLIGLTQRRGLTLVPLRLYFKDDRAKVELGLGRGRRQYDKREAIARRDAEREIKRSLKRRS